jgi:hypothetical protein
MKLNKEGDTLICHTCSLAVEEEQEKIAIRVKFGFVR